MAKKIIDMNLSNRESLLPQIILAYFIILFIIFQMLMFTIDYPKDGVNKVFIAFVAALIISVLSGYLGVFDGITLYFYPVKEMKSFLDE